MTENAKDVPNLLLYSSTPSKLEGIRKRGESIDDGANIHRPSSRLSFQAEELNEPGPECARPRGRLYKYLGPLVARKSGPSLSLLKKARV